MSQSENEHVPPNGPASPEEAKPGAKAKAESADRELSDAELASVSAAGTESDPSGLKKGDPHKGFG